MTTSPDMTTAAGRWWFRRRGNLREFLVLTHDADVDAHVDAGCVDKEPCGHACPVRTARWRRYTTARVVSFDLADPRLVLTLTDGDGDFTSGTVTSIDEARIPGLAA